MVRAGLRHSGGGEAEDQKAAVTGDLTSAFGIYCSILILIQGTLTDIMVNFGYSAV